VIIAAALAVLTVVAALLAWRLTRVSRELRRLHAAQADPDARQRMERLRAVAEERERIYSDLHDDIGAKLLDLIYTADKPEQADIARALLQDLRDVVTRSRGTPGTLTQVLGEIRAEAEDRLAAAEVELDWQQAAELPDPALDHGHALHLFRIVREALTNALRHARPRRIRIRAAAAAGMLTLDITDEGNAAAARTHGEGGRGTASMQSRASELRGSIRWDAGTLGGTKVVLRVPLPDLPA
jgi:signal transduction histidine kinase